MELLNQVTSTQLLFPAVAVAGVLIAVVLVFVFGIKSAQPPQFDKLPLLVDDRKGSSKKRKTKEKKTTSNGQVVHEPEVKSKKVTSESSKKSPTKEKKEQSEKKEKAKEKASEVKSAEKKTPKKEPTPKQEKKPKQPAVKPADFDDGDWEKVPTKNDKKSRKTQEEPKKDSPAKDKKKNKEAKKEEVVLVEVEILDAQAPPAPIKEEKKNAPQIMDKDLLEKVNELQRVLNEVEKRERSQTPVKVQNAPPSPTPAPEPEVAQKKKDEKVEKAPQKNSKKEVPKDSDDFVVPEVNTENGAVFDELGDIWTDAKVPKKGKKKARKDQ